MRDREFCKAEHRRKYGERLSKSLHDISAPEPPPAGVAGFADGMPLQAGNTTATLCLFQRHHLQRQFPRLWTLSLDLSDPAVYLEEPEPVFVEQPTPSHPPMVERWMSAPGADPVAAFLKYAAAATPVLAARAPRFAAQLEPTPVTDKVRHFPALCQSMQPVPAAEPVAAFVRASAHTMAIETRPTLRFAGNLALAARIDPAAHALAMVTAWEASPAPEPVAAFLRASSHTVAIDTLPALRIARKLELAAQIDRAAHAPAMVSRWEPTPAPELVAAFVQASAFTDLLAAPHTVQLPHFTAELEPTPVLDMAVTPDPCDDWMSSPAAEPVAAFVQASTALAFEAIALHLPTISVAMHEALPLPAIAVRVTALEPVANGAASIAALTPTFVPAEFQLTALAPATLQSSRPATSDKWIARGADSELRTGIPSFASSLPAAIAAPVLPEAQFTADLEPLPTLDELLDPPAMRQAFLPGLAAEPVTSYLRASVAGQIEIFARVTLPAALDFLAVPHVPRIRQSQTAPFAEAVMAKVLPVAATAPFVMVRKSPVALPAVPAQVAGVQFENPLGATASGRPEAVESLLDAAFAMPIAIQRAPRSSALTAPGLFAPAPVSSDFVRGLEPDPLESQLIAALAEELAMARNLRMLPLAMAAALERSIPSFPALLLAPAVSQPVPALARREEPQPVATVGFAKPAPSEAALDNHLPQHELAPLEFHTARLRGEPVVRPEWINTRIALLPPRFALRAALDKLDEPAAQPKKPVKTPEILNMPAAKRQPTVFMVAGRVAAAFLLASSLWYGVTNYRAPRVNSEDLATTGPAIAREPSGPAAPAAPGAAAPAPSKGAFTWMKDAIAERASLKVAENFKSIDAWEGSEKARPANWRRHADGYMNSGSLALFSPTLKFKDYRMEFFGQIEQKSIGWTVRSKDASNYHAMKLSVIEAGTRPFVALVQYNVVDGVAGRKTQTPLNIMVHNNRPMQFAIDVKGSHLVTSIDGEEVDSSVDGTLLAGGVGFFSETGERARLYWLRVARNDDWLGHVCAMLADTVSTTATLRAPAGPAGPLPGLPAGEDSLLLGAAWLGLPYLRASRKTQPIKIWRSEPWNS
ncbi:MAG: hypothetical protein ABI806_17970 [Candidatus Solibacter sp.]